MLSSDIVFSHYGLTALVAVFYFHNFSLIICRALHIAWARSSLADILEVLAPPAFTWLHDHAHRFGFDLSFPQGNEFGYVYEPWHWCFTELRPHR
ncbi:MAG: D-alanyl-D-alanine carboxypeptidase family protein [Candidatus Thiodiazotropha sp.]